jgi:hypothetical protein
VAYAPWVVWLLLRGEVPWSWPAAVGIGLSGLIHLAYSLCLQRGYQVAVPVSLSRLATTQPAEPAPITR